MGWNAISLIARRKIEEAMEEGAFDDLPLAGQPIDLRAEANVPHELRMAYHILKNANVLPPEVELQREISQLRRQLARAVSPAARQALTSRLRFKETQLAEQLDRWHRTGG